MIKRKNLDPDLRTLIDGHLYNKINFVKSASDSNYQNFINDHESGRVFGGMSLAYDAVTSGHNDLILVDINNSHSLTSMLTITKNRFTIMGMGTQGRYFGQRARLSMGVTTAATDIGAIQNTGVGNSFKNLKILSSNTVTESIYAVVEAGEYAVWENIEMYKETDLDVTGAAELVQNGDSALFKQCTIGSNVNAISGAIIRPCVQLTRDIVSGKVSRDSMFDDCLFWRNCGNTANRFIYGAGANTVERMLLIKDSVFWNTALAAATPAQNVAFSATLTDGSVLLKDCSSIGAATAMSTTTGVFVDSPVPAAATSGISVQAS